MILALILLVVKATVLAGFALAITALAQRRPAAERVVVLRAAVLVLLALPCVALLGPNLKLEIPMAAEVQTFEVPATALQVAVDPSEIAVARPRPELLLAVWATGALLLVARFALGVATLARWSRRAEQVRDAAWLAALHRFSARRRPSLRVSADVATPLSWGLSPGRILIGPAQLARPEEAQAVLAHELAHIRRGDWPFLVLSRLVVALFWFHPLIWTLARRLEALSEQAVDEIVVRRVDRELYARTLLGAARLACPHPAHSAAAGMTGPARSLAERIKVVMSNTSPAPVRPWTAAAAVGALLVVATPLAALELSQSQSGFAPPVPPAPMAAPPAPAPAAFVALPAAPPPAPLRPQAPPAPPTPPAPPEGRAIRFLSGDGGAYVVEENGVRRPMTDDERREVVAARQAAREARQQAHQARADARLAAAQARAAAVEARTQARAARSLHHDGHGPEAGHLHAAAEARTRAAAARAEALVARDQARRAVADARVQMGQGADEMERGARHMRSEAERLRDPDYRARQIERAREQGRTVTDQQLLDAIPRMLDGADRMERGAEQMRSQASRAD